MNNSIKVGYKSKVLNICFLLFLFFTLLISCEKKNNALEDEESVESFSEDEVESFLVYEQGVVEKVKYSIIEPISIYVTVKGDDIIGFSLRDNIAGFTSRNNGLIYFDSIELSVQEFNTLKSVLEKTLEWDSVARKNDVDEFTKNIPFTIASNNISWIPARNPGKHTIKKGETLTLEFRFSWKPSYAEYARSALDINSNTISASGSKETFSFSKKNMHRDEIELLLGNITDEKIQEAIKNGRVQQVEDEARKTRTEVLFN
jgi:hypothetical protein